VKVFTLVDEVGPCGGGTMLLPGVHHLVDRYRTTFDRPPAGGKANWQPFLRQHPPLGDLLRGATMADGGRSMVDRRLGVDGVDVEVVELRGEPGDVWITHLHVFHTASPNTSTAPRQMLANAIFAADPPNV
jgi:ectoine hydroxylase-related dioxygenase (phytanoyl-CoA dioxygenase family)